MEDTNQDQNFLIPEIFNSLKCKYEEQNTSDEAKLVVNEQVTSCKKSTFSFVTKVSKIDYIKQISQTHCLIFKWRSSSSKALAPESSASAGQVLEAPVRLVT